jgi:hypothetical protein
MPVLSRRSALGGGPPRRLSATPPHGSTRVAGSEASGSAPNMHRRARARPVAEGSRAGLLTVIAPSVRSISQKRAHVVNQHKMVQGARANLRRATQAKERADGPEHKKASTRKRLPTERGVRPLSALSRRAPARSTSLSLLYVCVLVPHAQAPLLSSGGLAASSWVARGSAHLFSAHLLALEELAQRHEAHVLKGGDALVSDA